MLEVYNVSGGYEGKDVVTRITFSVHPGEFIGILGPNGSGKSTLLKMISGELPIHSGQVKVRGKILSQYKQRDLAQIMAVLPQSTDSSFSFSVKEAVALGRYPYQKGLFKQWSESDEKAVMKALQQTKISKFQFLDLLTLSGGEKQRVFLAQALAQEPDIFLLDEPTNHLDLSHQKALMDLLKRWTVERQLTVVSVFHDLNLASLYCDRLMLLNSGKMVSIGTPWEVLKQEQVQQVYDTEVKRQPHPDVPRPQLAIMPDISETEELADISVNSLEMKEEQIVFRAPFPLKTVSSSVINSGIGWFSTFVNRHVDDRYNCEDSGNEMKQYLQNRGFNPLDTVAMMTAVSLLDGVVKEYKDGETSLFVVITAGIGGAVDVSRSYEFDRSIQPGTINIWIFVNGHLSEEAFIQGIVTATEAKTKALYDLNVRDSLSSTIATGTATDSILLASTQKGIMFQYGGPVTSLGKGIGKCVYDATVDAIHKYMNKKGL